MKINFNELKEIDVPNMNGGNGVVKSKMFMNNDCKIIKAVLEPNDSMGKHIQKNSEFIYVISGQAKIILVVNYLLLWQYNKNSKLPWEFKLHL